ncbi:inversin [Apiospora hydei]|uniref:Inversin n=1 Tax=Apiospora hydei TaxID=1337664 RepID=A0ABR1UVM0_9PEZI
MSSTSKDPSGPTGKAHGDPPGEDRQSLTTGSTRLYREALARFTTKAEREWRDDKARRLLHQFLCERDTPERSWAAAKNLKQDSSLKCGDHHIAGGIKIRGAWIENILSNIQSFISVGNYAMEHAPESLGLAWFAVSFALKAIQSDFELYGLFGSGLTDITEIMIIIPPLRPTVRRGVQNSRLEAN